MLSAKKVNLMMYPTCNKVVYQIALTLGVARGLFVSFHLQNHFQFWYYWYNLCTQRLAHFCTFANEMCLEITRPILYYVISDLFYTTGT